MPLKKQGREYKACCPFHGEKTPSFWVSPEKQFYHCFGCGAHGTVIGFLMSYDRLSFPEAIEELAGRLGLEVPREGGDGQGGAKRVDDERVRADGEASRASSPSSSRATTRVRNTRPRSAASRRRRSSASASATRRIHGTTCSAASARTTPPRQQLAELGLIIERERGQVRDGERHYDRFRDRLMFPIRDARGRVIAFGGRIIDQGEPKYLNSPETIALPQGPRALRPVGRRAKSRAP